MWAKKILSQTMEIKIYIYIHIHIYIYMIVVCRWPLAGIAEISGNDSLHLAICHCECSFDLRSVNLSHEQPSCCAAVCCADFRNSTQRRDGRCITRSRLLIVRQNIGEKATTVSSMHTLPTQAAATNKSLSNSAPSQVGCSSSWEACGGSKPPLPASPARAMQTFGVHSTWNKARQLQHPRGYKNRGRVVVIVVYDLQRHFPSLYSASTVVLLQTLRPLLPTKSMDLLVTPPRWTPPAAATIEAATVPET